MKFLKLDRAVMSNFGSVEKNRVITVKTNVLSIIINLFKNKAPNILFSVISGISDSSSLELIEGNVYRKQVDYPKIFKMRIINKPYILYKTLQASLLRRLLKILADSYNEDELTFLIFNGSISPDNIFDSIKTNHRRVYIENGFFPNTLQIDRRGVNAANSLPREAEYYLNLPSYGVQDLPTKVQVRRLKVSYPTIELPNDYIFLPFQIPSDQQIRVHSRWIRTMDDFMDLIILFSTKYPDKNFVIKEHPSFRQSIIGKKPLRENIFFANGNSTEELIKNSRLVITLNSTVGIEALLFSKPVITLADACYNIDGLTRHASSIDKLNEFILDEGWLPDERLRTQFLGYIWNEYLFHGYFNNLPSDTLLKIESILQT
ncbi:MAG: nitrogen fixation protein FixF [Rhodobiaceae bacterium]|nr:nitrogen fixation protein FixF [Rhodobiaceae bacterium]